VTNILIFFQPLFCAGFIVFSPLLLTIHFCIFALFRVLPFSRDTRNRNCTCLLPISLPNDLPHPWLLCVLLTPSKLCLFALKLAVCFFLQALSSSVWGAHKTSDLRFPRDRWSPFPLTPPPCISWLTFLSFPFRHTSLDCTFSRYFLEGPGLRPKKVPLLLLLTCCFVSPPALSPPTSLHQLLSF
jgi:hypothetical protein